MTSQVFFDHLDHGILKDCLKRIVGVRELSDDWYAVYRAVSKYRCIEREDLQKHAVFGPKLADKTREPIATIAEVKAAGIKIRPNPNKFGIPQGTPISSVFSNLYLIDFDRILANECAARDALYRRYSDDILIICPIAAKIDLTAIVESSLADHRLNIATDKTEEKLFGSHSAGAFQYLGFNISPKGAVIRPSSLARQWRKAKRAINSTKQVGLAAMAAGKADKIYVSKLRKRFSPVGSRNFSSYSRRAGDGFTSRKIARQVSRLERKIDNAIRDLQKL